MHFRESHGLCVWRSEKKTRKLTQSEKATLGACHYDLDLWPFDPKIYRRLPFFILHLCMKYEVCRSNTLRVIALQRSVDRRTDRQTDGQTDRQTDRVITIGLPYLRWRGPKYKNKRKQPLDPLSYPPNIHTRPYLWQISWGGGCPEPPPPLGSAHGISVCFCSRLHWVGFGKRKEEESGVYF